MCNLREDWDVFLLGFVLDRLRTASEGQVIKSSHIEIEKFLYCPRCSIIGQHESNKGRFIIYGDDRVGKSERNICFFPDTRVKIMPEF